MFSIIPLLFCSLVLSLPLAAAALTVEEIQLLQQNGVSETTIQMMLESEKRAQSLPDSTSQSSMGVTTITRPDGKKAIVYSTGRDGRNSRDAEERLKEARAWELLRHLIVDTRSTAD